jgi:hypothetical protein
MEGAPLRGVKGTAFSRQINVGGFKIMKLSAALSLSGVFITGMFFQNWLTHSVATAAAAPVVIEAQKFILKDTAGHTRAELILEPNGKPALKFYDQNGKTIWAAPTVMVSPAYVH